MKMLMAGFMLAAMALLAMPQQAAAVSLLSPAGAVDARHASEGTATEVRWRRGHHRHYRGWHRHRGWHARRHWRPRYFAPRYYAPIRRCRVVWTYYGPQRVCRYRYI